MSKPLIEAKGVGGQLELYEDKVTIKRSGILGMMGGLRGAKDIYLSQISSIQFRDAGLVNGFIQFMFMGGSENKGGVTGAAGDENSVMFNTWQKKPFKAIKEALDKKIAARESNRSSSGLNDLEKLSELKTKGIITEEEFNAKKKQLLGL